MSIVNIDIFTIYIFLIFTQAFDFKDLLQILLLERCFAHFFDGCACKSAFLRTFFKSPTSQTYAWRPPSWHHRA